MSEPHVGKSASNQIQTHASPKTPIASKKRNSTHEEVRLRRITLYFVIGLCTFSALAGTAAFFLKGDIEALALFQIPTVLCLYRILCYLYPSSETSPHPIVNFLQTLFKHKM